ncbi:MAG: hypothetical protein AB1898_13435 [Acidobacteriota bacterium]
MLTETVRQVDTSRREINIGHRVRLLLPVLGLGILVVLLLVVGHDYYGLSNAQRLESPKHLWLKPSGKIGLRLGMLGAAFFGGLYLYPIRKRWKWLGRIGKTRHWLDFHVFFGVAAPLVITFHSSFKFQGLAGVAYWIMIAVMLSGFIGRYFYAQIPRSLSSAEMSLREMQATGLELTTQLAGQRVLSEVELAPLLSLPDPGRIAHMPLMQALFQMILIDFRRPFLVSKLRRKRMSLRQRVLSLGGFFPSLHPELEKVIATVRQQSWIMAKILFLERTRQVFHLWHVVHRPFSYSFALLATIHVLVVILLGYF